MGANFTVKKVLDIFGSEINRNTLLKAEAGGQIPTPERYDTGAIKRRMWTIADLPIIGERYGYLKKPQRPLVLSTFTLKGGVLKTTLALNIARTAALHNIRTCVIGLDLQGDISGALGLNADIDESESMESAILKLESPRGLYDFYQGDVTLDSLLVDTDIPTLKFIPETPELVQLEKAISFENRHEEWLKGNVIDVLQSQFDLIILDCSPNWNRLVTNALTACDVLVSPLECKINNFRNFNVFHKFLRQFHDGMKLGFETVFVPTRFTSTRKLSAEIRNWYHSNVSGCSHGAIRESTAGEEAVAMRISLPEYAPTSLQADEMREILVEIWMKVLEAAKKKHKQTEQGIEMANPLEAVSTDRVVEAQL